MVKVNYWLGVLSFDVYPLHMHVFPSMANDLQIDDCTSQIMYWPAEERLFMLVKQISLLAVVIKAEESA